MTRTPFAFLARRPSSAGAPPRRPASLREAWPALVGLSAVFLFEMLDNSILNVALPTIGRELAASTIALQWVTGVYAVVFGSLMLVFGAIADRYGRRRIMLLGLVLLTAASLATLVVHSAEELIAVRAAMGVAAAMTTPGSAALAYRLFDTESLRVRAIAAISTVGLVGLAVGPTIGGAVLAVAPWQVLLVANAPVALLALAGIARGIPADDPAQLHRDPADVAGGALGTVAIVLALIAPTLFVDLGAGSWAGWSAVGAAVAATGLFILRERTARHPLLDLALVARPLVASGLAYKAATGLAVAGMGYLVALQLQLGYGWPPVLAAVGMLPQVVVLLALGPVVQPFVQRVGIVRAAWLSSAAVVVGLVVYAGMGRLGYPWVAVALALVAAGLRVNGVVAAVNVISGLPADRTTLGAALTDTSSEVASGAGIAVGGTVLAAFFTGDIAAAVFTPAQSAAFGTAATITGSVLALLAGGLVAAGIVLGRRPETPGAVV